MPGAEHFLDQFESIVECGEPRVTFIFVVRRLVNEIISDRSQRNHPHSQEAILILSAGTSLNEPPP